MELAGIPAPRIDLLSMPIEVEPVLGFAAWTPLRPAPFSGSKEAWQVADDLVGHDACQLVLGVDGFTGELHHNTLACCGKMSSVFIP